MWRHGRDRRQARQGGQEEAKRSEARRRARCDSLLCPLRKRAERVVERWEEGDDANGYESSNNTISEHEHYTTMPCHSSIGALQYKEQQPAIPPPPLLCHGPPPPIPPPPPFSLSLFRRRDVGSV